MAKRTKTSARAGKVKRPAQKPEWKAVENKEEVEEDVDSDDGSFVDDDTEDFLPSGWTGKTKGRKENTAAQGLNQQFAIPKTKLTTSKNASDIAENTQRITPTLHQVTLKSTATRPDDLPSHLVDKSEEKPRNVISPTSQTQTANEPTEAETITVSRLEVRASLLRKPSSTTEGLQEQINSLKQVLKTAKTQVASTKSELEGKIKKQIEEIKKLQIELTDKNNLRSEQYLALKNGRREIEAQRMKATDDYRKLMNVHTALNGEKKSLEKQLASEKVKFILAEKEIEKLRQEQQEQDLKIRQLARQVNEGLAEKGRLDSRIAVAEHAREFSQRAYSTVFWELQNARSQLTTASNTQRSNQRVRTDLGRLQRDHDNLRRDYDDAKQEIGDLKRDIRDLKGDKRLLQRQLDDAEDESLKKRGTIGRQANIIKDLKSEVLALESERDLKAPILQIGIDVRLRNFEHARETLLNTSRDESNRALITNGNTAAHRANGAVDAAMFQADLVPDEYIEDAEEIFSEMYEVEPSKYGCWSPKVLRLIDCRATVNTVKAFRGRNASSDLRDEHAEIDSRLIDLHKSMAQRTFESNREVDELIQKLELLTTEIVEVDRSRGGRH
jgi:hypothetical protein